MYLSDIVNIEGNINYFTLKVKLPRICCFFVGKKVKQRVNRYTLCLENIREMILKVYTWHMKLTIVCVLTSVIHFLHRNI